MACELSLPSPLETLEFNKGWHHCQVEVSGGKLRTSVSIISTCPLYDFRSLPTASMKISYSQTVPELRITPFPVKLSKSALKNGVRCYVYPYRGSGAVHPNKLILILAHAGADVFDCFGAVFPEPDRMLSDEELKRLGSSCGLITALSLPPKVAVSCERAEANQIVAAAPAGKDHTAINIPQQEAPYAKSRHMPALNLPGECA